MVKYRFPYAIEDTKSCPKIPVYIGYKESWEKTISLLDSGADISLFTRELGEEIGLDIESVEPKKLGGIGNGIYVHIHKVKLKISKDGKEIIFRISAGFANDRKWDLNIIGRKDIFNKITVCFKKDKEVIIEI